MDKNFRPLLPDNGKGPGSAGVRVLPSGAAAEGFQPLKAATAAVMPQRECAATGRPIVTLHRDGQRVSRIHIQCACGQVIELECQYPEPAKTAC